MEHFQELHLCIPGFVLDGLCLGGGGTFAFTSTSFKFLGLLNAIKGGFG